MTRPVHSSAVHPGEGRGPVSGCSQLDPGLRRGGGRGGRHHLALLSLLALAACGKAAGLEPLPGRTLPVAPRGARATPTPADLLTPTPQQRPLRGDELLRSSQERRSDEFDLPPE